MRSPTASLVVLCALCAAGCGGSKSSGPDPVTSSTVRSTTTSVAPVQAQRYIGTFQQPAPLPALPLDLTVFFNLPRASVRSVISPRAVFDITGGYNTGPGGFTGSITGSFDGTVEGGGTFTGVMTANLANGCVARRNYSGPLTPQSLNWTPGAQLETCGGSSPLTAPVNPPASTQPPTTSTVGPTTTTSAPGSTTTTSIGNTTTTVSTTTTSIGGGPSTTTTTSPSSTTTSVIIDSSTTSSTTTSSSTSSSSTTSSSTTTTVLPVCSISLNSPTTFNISASAQTVTATGTASTVPCDSSTRFNSCPGFLSSGSTGNGGGANFQFNLTVTANTGGSRSCSTQIVSNITGAVWGTVQINQAAGP